MSRVVEGLTLLTAKVFERPQLYNLNTRDGCIKQYFSVFGGGGGGKASFCSILKDRW